MGGFRRAPPPPEQSANDRAGKFTSEAPSTGPVLISRMIKCHYNWKYMFLHPSIDEIIKRYLAKFHKEASMASVEPTAAPTAVPTAAPTPAPTPVPTAEPT